MTELPLIALGGLLASSHCVGMCGGFAITIGMGSKHLFDNVSRQTIYSLGRVFTYTFLGATAGFAGFWFANRTAQLVHAQAILSIAAGTILIVQALLTLGFIPKRWLAHKGQPVCLLGSFVGPFLASPHRSIVFLAGMLNGLLPCGLVYGYLALATSTARLTSGFQIMLAFGLGTIPIMIVTGISGALLSRTARQRVFQVAAICVLLTGLLAVNRGLLFWNTGLPIRCPGCLSTATNTSI
jgi:hypothetical protein